MKRVVKHDALSVKRLKWKEKGGVSEDGLLQGTCGVRESCQAKLIQIFFLLTRPGAAHADAMITVMLPLKANNSGHGPFGWVWGLVYPSIILTVGSYT